MAMIEKKSLVLMRDVDGVATTFPIGSAPAVLGTFTYTGERMGGAPSITATLMYPRCLDDEWTYKEYVEFRGEKYYVRQIPTSSKSNEELFYKHEITLVSERDILEHVLFYDAVTDRTEELYQDRYRTNNTNLSTQCDIIEFISRLNDSLVYRGLSDWKVVAYDDVTSDTILVSFEDKTIAEAMQEIYNTFELPYRWIGKTCYVGTTADDILSDVTLEYGADNGLLSVTKTNDEYDIIDCITGHGSSDNIPWFYPNANAYGTAIYNVKRPTATLGSTEITYEDITSYVLDIDLESLLRNISDPYNKQLTVCTRVSSAVLENNQYYPKYRPILDSDGGGPQCAPYVVNYCIPKNSSVNIPLTFEFYRKEYSASGTTYERTYNFHIKEFLVTDDINGSYTVARTQSAINISVGDDWVEHTVSITPVFETLTEYPSGKYCVYTGAITTSVNQVDCVSYTESGETKYASREELGIEESLLNPLRSGDIITVTNRKWITPTGNLMPTVYRTSKGADRFYKALNETYTAPDDIADSEKDANGKYIFNNPYVEGNPHEAVQDFEDIKPSIVGVRNGEKKEYDLTTQTWKGQLIGEIADVAFDENDSDLLASGDEQNSWFNEPDKYLHSYFYIKLHKFNGTYGFNLFDHALADESAYIEMTSGNCAGCKFQIGVYKEPIPVKSTTTYKFYNPVKVDDNGDIVSGNIEDKCFRGNEIESCIASQQNTKTSEVWLAVRKDNDTFGVVLPNATNNVKPQAGDTFVITGISLPDELVYAAENELEEELIRYMKENNDEHFTFSVTFSRIWLAMHPDFTNKLSENALLLVRYNGVVHTLYVTSYSFKADDNILYEVTVELSDEIELSQSGFSSKVSAIAAQVLSSMYGKGAATKENIAGLASYFLRKDSADTASGFLKFLAGFSVDDAGKYGMSASGDATAKSITSDTATLGSTTISQLVSLLSGANSKGDFATGLALYLTASGMGRIECDQLLVRNKAVFNELEIRKLSYSGGNIVLSPAGSVIERVTYITADGTEYSANEDGLYVNADGNKVTPVTYRCYYKADDGTTATTNTWEVDDQARCQTFNRAASLTDRGTTENRFYWRRVTAVSDDGYVDLSVTDCADNSDVPKAGDSIVQMGNRTNTKRQGFIYLQSEGEGSPSIEEYVGVWSYTLTDCLRTRISPTQGNLFTGTFQVMSGGKIIKQPVYRGDYDSTAKYSYYDQVTYNGDLWLCIVASGNATEAPSDSSQQWKRQTNKDQDKEWYIDADLNGSEYVAENETRQLDASLFYGTDNMDEQVEAWRIERTSTDTAADTAWNNATDSAGNYTHKNLDKGTALDYAFTQADLTDSEGNVLDSCKFTVYCDAEQVPTSTTVLVSADGEYYTDENDIPYTL